MSVPTHNPPFLSIQNVTAGYSAEQPVFEDFNLTVDEPGVMLVEGGNGAGKTTLVEVVSGYLRPLAGTVQVRDVDASASHAADLRRICRTEPALYPMMTARDHIAFASRWRSLNPGLGINRAASYGMAPWLDTAADALSTGNRRKLWLIMCTLGDVDLLLLDEPFNGLDGPGVDLLCSELENWAESRAVLVVAHRPPQRLRTVRSYTLDGGAPEL